MQQMAAEEEEAFAVGFARSQRPLLRSKAEEEEEEN